MIATVLKTLGVLGAIGIGLLFASTPGSLETSQLGYRGVGMELVATHDELDEQGALNVAPPAFPPASKDGALSGQAYENVQVLGHLTTGEFTRLMTAITTWVSPEQGCNYCHNPENMASDEIYTKVVSRRMIQMTMQINSKWQRHVKGTGVTCYTCHRGQNVPGEIWFANPDSDRFTSLVGNLAGQNSPSEIAANASLPFDPLTPYLENAESIRVVGQTALPTGNRSSIKQAEWTYSLMMHFSDSLGVNCTYCHNSRAFTAWEQSPATRGTAWHGIQMVRQLNNGYLKPLQATYPANRLGPKGDAPKANCKTCHRGAYKPLLGAKMLEGYPSLAGPKPQPPKLPPAPPPSEAPDEDADDPEGSEAAPEGAADEPAPSKAG